MKNIQSVKFIWLGISDSGRGFDLKMSEEFQPSLKMFFLTLEKLQRENGSTIKVKFLALVMEPTSLDPGTKTGVDSQLVKIIRIMNSTKISLFFEMTESGSLRKMMIGAT